MIKKYALIFLIFITANYSSIAQNLGDIAFLQYIADGSGTTVKFLVLNDIPNGNQIHFTDNGWFSAGGFRGGEGVHTWTSPGVFCGDVISFTESPMVLSTGGDQILAYTGTSASPTFIAAIQMNGAWDADATSSNTSAIPTGLTNGTNCIAISPEIDNAIYSGTLTGTRATLLAAINDQTNWTVDNDLSPVNLTFSGTFTITDCPTPVCTLSASGYANVMCNDNSTPSNNTDDYITFDLDPSGSLIGATYSVTVSSGTITPNTGIAYGSPTTFTLQNGSAGAGNVTVTIQDIIGPACTLDQLIVDPGSCNAICNITSAGFSNQLCNDNGTSAIDTDDYITFVLDPTGSTLATIYSVTVSSGTITPNSGISYGGPVAFTLQNGSAGAGNVTVTIVDDVDGTCTFPVSITDNGECSSTNCATELFISEYAEGSGSNKYIEIYNGTGANVDLSDYQLWKIAGGGSWAEAIANLSGTLADGDVYVVANSLANATILALADNTGANAVTNYNGDDAVGLAKDDGSGTYVLIDSVGEDGADPGSGWDVAGILNGTQNRTLVRKTSVISPTTNWAASAGTTAANSEWIVYSIDYWTYLGDHDDCTVTCTPTHTITSFDPSSGPIGTEVTIFGDDFSTSSIVSFNGTSSLDHTYIDSDGDSIIDTIIAVVPTGSTTGVITVTEATCDLDTVSDFTILESIGTCSGGYSDLMLTEVYDAQSGSLGYLEVYNGTGGTLDLTNYSIRRYGDAAALAGGDYTLYNFPSTHTTIANGVTYFGKVFSGSDPGGPATPDFTFDTDCSNTFAFCGGFNVDDIFHLYYFDGTTDNLIDAYVASIASTGFSALRNTNTTGPNNPDDPSDWTITGTESIADLGNFIATPPGNIPSASAPTDVSGTCTNTAVFSTIGTPGSGGTLTYEWYYYDPGSTTWMVVNGTNLPLITTITGETTNTLTLNGGLASYNGYQFYCLVTENATCSYISDAAQIKIDSTVWNGTAWSSPPTIDKIATINGAFNTATHGSFYACSLIVNSTFTVAINDGGFIEIYNDLINNGTFNIDNNGSLVQIDDNGLNIGNISVQRMASIKNRDYVYWSSPVTGFLVNNISPTTPTNYLFKWHPTWANPNGTQGYWLSADGDTMDAGLGYIVRAPNGHPAPATLGALNFTTTFNNGVPHNGEYIIQVSRGATAGSEDDDWNLLGNPYPSSINAIDFLNNNLDIEGFIDIWTHGTSPAAIASPFYENFGLNYTDADYLTYNSSGSSSGAGTFNGFIASGQGFMVNVNNGGTANFNVTFNNVLRSRTNNAEFFKTVKGKETIENRDSAEKHRIWLDLISPSFAHNRILVGYIEGATMGIDRMFDAKDKTLSTQNFYSLIEDDSFIIQGRALPFDVNDAIPLGMNIIENGSHIIAIGEVDGVFLNGSQNVYLKDKVRDVIHNLTLSPYSFTVEEGILNDRFEIVFGNRLSTDENTIDSNQLSIIELQNGNVRFSVGPAHKIETVEIIDVLGRSLYRFKGNNSTEIYNLSQLSQATYIAKVLLDNGQVITKKAIKRN